MNHLSLERGLKSSVSSLINQEVPWEYLGESFGRMVQSLHPLMEEHFFILTNQNGIVISSYGSQAALSNLAKVEIRNGYSFAMPHAGRNAIFLSMEKHNTAFVYGKEHEQEWFNSWNCLCKPIYLHHDIVGYLDLSIETGREAAVPRTYEVTGTKEHMTPIHFSLEITTRCNLRCQHCYRSSSPDIKEEEMSYEQIISILQKMHAIGARHIEVTGGELFLHRRIKDIMTYIGDHFDFIGILTNGTALPESMINHLEPYKDKLIWSISLDSCVPEHHDQFRGMKGAFERTVKAIKTLTSRDHAVRVSMSVSEDNIGDVEDTLLFVKDELKAMWFGYNYILPYGRGKDLSWSIPQSEINTRYNEIDAFVDRFPGFTNKMSPQQVEDMRTRQINCGAGWRTLTIGSNGVVRPCVLMEESYLSLGNILDLEVPEMMRQDTVNALLNLPWPLDKDCSGCSNESFCKYCAYRGFLVNSERVQQGLDLCAWAEKNKVQEFIRFEETGSNDDSAASCYMKNCSMS